MPVLEGSVASGRIASALLDQLAAEGDAEGRARALEACAQDETALRAHAHWLPPERLHTVLARAEIDLAAAKRVGLRLASHEGLGLAHRVAGMGRVEGVLRRCDWVLPREWPGDRYEVRGVKTGQAEIAFVRGEDRPVVDPAAGTQQGDLLLCAVRRGMFQGLPLLHWASPVSVRETRCVHRGDSECVFQLAWSRRKLFWRGALGATLGLVSGAAAGSWLLASPVPWSQLVPTGLALVGAGAGLAVAALSGARARLLAARGQIASSATVVAQADRAIAQRMDELARLDAAASEDEAKDDAPERDERAERARLGQLEERVGAVGTHLGELAAALGDGPGEPEGPFAQLLDRAMQELAQADALVVSLSRGETAEGDAALTLGRVDLVERATRVANAVARELPRGVALERHFDGEAAELEVYGDEREIEALIEGLIDRALEGFDEEGGHIDVALRAERAGASVTIEVSDDGPGLEIDELERVFDALADWSPELDGLGPAALGDAMGGESTLERCNRIARMHGGTLQLESAPDSGTRARVRLPVRPSAGD